MYKAFGNGANFIALVFGYLCIGFMFFVLIASILESLDNLLRKLKDRTEIIKKGTIMYENGEKVEIAKDLKLRFVVKKVIVCECEGLSIIKGISEEMNKDVARLDFEDKLLKLYKDNTLYMSNFIRKSD